MTAPRVPMAAPVLGDEELANVIEAVRSGWISSLGAFIGIFERDFARVCGARHGVAAEKVNKVLEGRPHIVDAIKNGDVQLVLNTTEGAKALEDSRSLRREALLHKVPYYTTLSGAVAAALGIKAYLAGDLEVRALQGYFDGSAASRRS